MSDDGQLTRFIERAADQSDAKAEESTEESQPFGWLRGSQRERAVMLELRKKNGDILALGYAWLERAEFDPSEGITLHFAGRTVRITGSNLNAETRPGIRLFEGLTRHRVVWIREMEEGGAQALHTAVTIESIRFDD